MTKISHNWSQSFHELAGPHGTDPIQHYECRSCKTTVQLPDSSLIKPPEFGCTGITTTKKFKIKRIK